MNIRLSVLVLAIGAAVAVLPADPAAAAGRADTATHATVHVVGQVANPTHYTAAQLAALPQTTVAGRHGPVTGVALTDLVTAAGPQVPATKNAQLRIVLTLTGQDGRRTRLAYGESDPDFGDHPALLVPHGGRADLVIPQDSRPTRSLEEVRRLYVGVAAPQQPAGVGGGALVVGYRGHRATLSAARLAALPQHDLTVTFGSSSGTQTHTEHGPTLAAVVRAAGLAPDPDMSVVAIGDDGYLAAVTLAENTVGGRPLLVSTAEDGTALAQPRLVTDGDLKGGRYVSGVVGLAVAMP